MAQTLAFININKPKTLQALKQRLISLKQAFEASEAKLPPKTASKAYKHCTTIASLFFRVASLRFIVFSYPTKPALKPAHNKIMDIKNHTRKHPSLFLLTDANG
jgi:hypothetical protein